MSDRDTSIDPDEIVTDPLRPGWTFSAPEVFFHELWKLLSRGSLTVTREELEAASSRTRTGWS